MCVSYVSFVLLMTTLPFFLPGKCYEKVCEMCQITLNKSAIFGDNGAICPGGVRIGKLQSCQFSINLKTCRVVEFKIFNQISFMF